MSTRWHAPTRGTIILLPSGSYSPSKKHCNLIRRVWMQAFPTFVQLFDSHSRRVQVSSQCCRQRLLWELSQGRTCEDICQWQLMSAWKWKREAGEKRRTRRSPPRWGARKRSAWLCWSEPLLNVFPILYLKLHVDNIKPSVRHRHHHSLESERGFNNSRHGVTPIQSIQYLLWREIHSTYWYARVCISSNIANITQQRQFIS